MGDSQQQQPSLPLSIATTVAVAAAAGAMGFVAVYWYTGDAGQHHLPTPTQQESVRAADGNEAGGQRPKKMSWLGWPWTLRSRSREAAGDAYAVHMLEHEHCRDMKMCPFARAQARMLSSWVHRSSSCTIFIDCAAAQVAAERLSALARTNEAIERDEQLAQVALDSLGDASPTAGGGSAAGAASTKLFTDADLPSLKMCHRWVC